MKRENRLLVTILVLLSLSVVVTGGLAVYLTLTREGGATVEVAVEPTATAIAPGEPRIAFISDREGDVAIYVMHTDGSHVQRVSGPNQGFYIHPSWSPDGRRVAYVGWEGNPFMEDDPDVGVWVAAADGSEHVRVSGTISGVNGILPTWSPDGTLLAFVTVGEPGGGDGPDTVIHVVWADGGITRSIPLPGYIITRLDWSPTGEDFLLVAGTPGDDSDVYLMSSEGQSMTQIFSGTWAADWSPDGKEIIVGDRSLETILVVGREQEPREVAHLDMQTPQEIAWSSDGTHIAVVTIQQRGPTALHVITLETGEITTVVDGDEVWLFWPNWSPDGSRLLFTMGEMRQRHASDLPYANLWVYDVASGGREQLTMGGGFEGLGVWSP